MANLTGSLGGLLASMTPSEIVIYGSQRGKARKDIPMTDIVDILGNRLRTFPSGNAPTPLIICKVLKQIFKLRPKSKDPCTTNRANGRTTPHAYRMAHQLLLVGVLHAVATLAMARPLDLAITDAARPPSSSSSSLELAAAPRLSLDASRPDKSIAGAEVILGGFAIVALAVIYCYIRVTRQHGHREKE
ncbi:hypothetical protein ZIOFF_058335 [Zingiber officinale]|uniref:Uncharacterized protein n=1 Tax=Zingiber officinale TaxID=94328 RepID=A0A8J5FAY3_ZINOF|nr:hypothetical protein ZIOFF_058335 [Zingiber officinale]